MWHDSQAVILADGSDFVVGDPDVCIETKQILPLSTAFFSRLEFVVLGVLISLIILEVVVS